MKSSLILATIGMAAALDVHVSTHSISALHPTPHLSTLLA